MTAQTQTAAPPLKRKKNAWDGPTRPNGTPLRVTLGEFGSSDDGWGSLKTWTLKTADSLAAVSGRNFFTGPAISGLQRGDIIEVVASVDQREVEYGKFLCWSTDGGRDTPKDRRAPESVIVVPLTLMTVSDIRDVLKGVS